MTLLTIILTSLGGLGGLAGIVALLQYLRENRSIRIRDDINEQTQGEQIEGITIGTLEKKLLYLEKVIDTQAKQIDTLIRQNEQFEERDARRLARIQELEERLDQALTNMRQMKRELIVLKEESTPN